MICKKLSKLFLGALAFFSVSFGGLISNESSSVDVEAVTSYDGYFSYQFFERSDFVSTYPNATVSLFTITDFASTLALTAAASTGYVPYSVTFDNGTLRSLTVLIFSNCTPNPFYTGAFFETHPVPWGQWFQTTLDIFNSGFELAPTGYDHVNWRTFDPNWSLPYVTSFVMPANTTVVRWSTNAFYRYFCDSNGHYNTWYQTNIDLLLKNIAFEVPITFTVDGPAGDYVELYIDNGDGVQTSADYVTDIATNTSYTLSRRYFEIGGDSIMFWVSGDDNYLEFEIDTLYGGNFSPVSPIGYSFDNQCILPYWEGEIEISVSVLGPTTGDYKGAFFSLDTSSTASNCGGTWAYAYYRGYDVGYGAGYGAGYSAGRNATLDVEQTVSLLWDGNDPVDVTYLYPNDVSTNTATLNDNLPRLDLKRPVGSKMIVRLHSSDYVASTVVIGSVSTRLTPTMVVNDYVYFPTWDNPILIYVRNTTTPFDGGLMPEDFYFDVNEYQNVFFGSYNPNEEVYQKGYSEGYDSGYEAGQDAAQSSVYDAGRSDGYVAGYSAGLEAGDGTMEVINIWGLMSAVITMPFTFFSQGLDWTLFAGSPYEFSVSIFFGSLLVILMLWKIIQLVIGLGK